MKKKVEFTEVELSYEDMSIVLQAYVRQLSYRVIHDPKWIKKAKPVADLISALQTGKSTKAKRLIMKLSQP